MKTYIASTQAVRGLLRNLFFLAGIMLTASNAVQGQQSVPCPNNINFEAGNFTDWICYTGTCCPLTATTNSGPVANRHEITSGPGLDPYGNFPVVAPGGGNHSLKLGNNLTGSQAERVRYYIPVPPGFNNYSFNFAYAVVFQQPNHAQNIQPRFEVKAYDSATGNPIVCATHTYISGAGLPGFQNSSTSGVLYLPWTNGSLNLSGQGGNTIIIEVSSGDCGAGGHFGYGYFDILSCGKFEAAVAYCDLDNDILTLEGPAGYQSYVWMDSALTTVLGNSQTLTLSVPTVPTNYKVIITPYNSNGCPDTISTPTIGNFTIKVSPDTICNTYGAPIQLNVDTFGGMFPFTYHWSPGATLSDTAIPNPIAYPTSNTNYIVKVSDTNGCFRRDTVIVQDPNYNIELGPDITTCLGTPVHLTPTLTPPVGQYTYIWTPSNDLSNGNILDPVYTPAAVGVQQLIIQVDSGLCRDFDTIRITTLPNTFQINDTTVCEGVVFTPTASGDPNFTYTWAPAINLSNSNILQPQVTADTTRVYNVIASYPTCPNIVKTFRVNVEPNPVVELGPDLYKCKYTRLLVEADVKPYWFNNYAYQWSYNSNIDDHAVPNIIFTGLDDTTLYLTVKTPVGCEGMDSVHVHVYPADFASVSPSDTAICPRNTVSMVASGAEIYKWVPSTYLDTDNGPAVVSSPQTTQSYTIYATDVNGCHDTLQAIVVVNPEALVSLPDSATLYPGEAFQMDPGGNCLYFTWFPPLGLSNAHIANPVASPESNTKYIVHGKTEAGCVATDSINIFVKDETVLDLPNAFTPGSAPNNMLKVVKRGIANMKRFTIYNRWGNKVFETSNIDEGWDGTFNGQPQPMGVYIYSIEAYTNKGTRFFKQGNVTLIR